MSYLGNEPRFSQFPSKFFDGDGSAMTVTLDYAPPNNAALLVFISGVRQDTSAYTLSGTSLTFTGTVPSGTANVQVVHLGQRVDAGGVADDSISTVKIQDDAVTAAKLANSINTEIAANTAKVTNATHTGDVTGATALTIADDAVDIAMLSATGTASATTFLRGDNSWTTVSDNTTQWQSVQTTGFTAVAGNGYPCNTTSGEFTVTLPASASVGDTIELIDYAGTWDTNKLTIDPQSLNLKGSSDTAFLIQEREGVRIVYVDATQGWIVATAANEGTTAIAASVTADVLVIAGGGSGGGSAAADRGHGGGGAGGYRNTYNSEPSGGGGSSETALTLIAGSEYTVTVGGGGAGVTSPVGKNSGTDSTISTITSDGGGGGGNHQADGYSGSPGGSGGGGGYYTPSGGAGGSGTANQGFDGASGQGDTPNRWGGGGGGASEAGSGGVSTSTGGAGGDGLSSDITASSITRGGGGGGGVNGGTQGPGGAGGGGAGSNTGGVAGSAATGNTGGGGGGSVDGAPGGSGGSGVVIMRLLTADYTGTTTGSPTVSTSGSDTILVFTGTGSYTA